MISGKMQSLPSWERGLKLPELRAEDIEVKVAPFVGAWIETVISPCLLTFALRVAPFVGAWIETSALMCACTTGMKSLPSWERGLKLSFDNLQSILL